MPPEDRTQTCNTWFEHRFRPLSMTGFLRQYLRGHFADPLSVQEIKLVGPPGDPLQTGLPLVGEDPASFLTIEAHHVWRPDVTDKRPAILIRREDCQVQRIGIADSLMGGPVERDGSKYYTVLVPGAHTLFCVARNGTQAELLGGEVFQEMLCFGQDIRKKLDLMRFTVAGLGKLIKLEEPIEHYAVPVTVMYVIQQTWRRVPQAPRLKTITFDATLP